jgi:hypothetical protein
MRCAKSFQPSSVTLSAVPLPRATQAQREAGGEGDAGGNGLGALGHPAAEVVEVSDGVGVVAMGSVECGVEGAELPAAAGKASFLAAEGVSHAVEVVKVLGDEIAADIVDEVTFADAIFVGFRLGLRGRGVDGRGSQLRAQGWNDREGQGKAECSGNRHRGCPWVDECGPA